MTSILSCKSPAARDPFVEIRAALLQHEECLRPALEEITRALIELVRAVEGAEERMANALRVLAQHGRSLAPEMIPSEAFACAEELATGRAVAAHAWLRAKSDARLGDIDAMFCAKPTSLP